MAICLLEERVCGLRLKRMSSWGKEKKVGVKALLFKKQSP